MANLKMLFLSIAWSKLNHLSQGPTGAHSQGYNQILVLIINGDQTKKDENYFLVVGAHDTVLQKNLNRNKNTFWTT